MYTVPPTQRSSHQPSLTLAWICALFAGGALAGILMAAPPLWARALACFVGWGTSAYLLTQLRPIFGPAPNRAGLGIVMLIASAICVLLAHTHLLALGLAAGAAWGGGLISAAWWPLITPRFPPAFHTAGLLGLGALIVTLILILVLILFVVAPHQRMVVMVAVGAISGMSFAVATGQLSSPHTT